MKLVFDIEASGYLYEADKVWWIVSKDIDTGLFERSTTEHHKEHLEYLMNADTLIGHNIIAYDIPLLKKIYPWFDIKIPDQVEDTFVMSSLFKPDRAGGHSLEQWGRTVRIPKLDWEDFTKFDDKMLDYCERDVQINHKVYDVLMRERAEHGWDWDKALKLEYRMAEIQAQQELTGVNFDIDKAYDLVEELQAEIDEIDRKLFAELPLRPVQHGAIVSKPFKKNGSYSKMTEDWYGT